MLQLNFGSFLSSISYALFSSMLIGRKVLLYPIMWEMKNVGHLQFCVSIFTRKSSLSRSLFSRNLVLSRIVGLVVCQFSGIDIFVLLVNEEIYASFSCALKKSVSL